MNKVMVRRQFERSAANYDLVAQMQRRIVDELMSAVGCSRGSIADLGCGTGYALSRMSRLGFARMAGLDIATTMIEIAKRQVPEASFKQGDLEALPYRDAEFSTVFSSSAIQWCDLALALSEVCRVLAPGGQLLLSSFRQGTLDAWRRLWRLEDEQRFLSLADFTATIHKAGFVEVRVWTHKYSQQFTSFEAAVRSIRDLGAGYNGSEQRQGLMGRRRYAQIKDRADRIVEQQGFLELDYDVVFVSANKPGLADD